MLGAMADRWRVSRESGVRLGVEAMTAEFSAAVDAIARDTIGVRTAVRWIPQSPSVAMAR